MGAGSEMGAGNIEAPFAGNPMNNDDRPVEMNIDIESGNMSGLSVECTENGSSDDELGVKLLDSCLSNSRITLTSLTSTTKKSFQSLVVNALSDEDPSDTTTIKNLSMSVSNHSFALKVTAKLDITATLKAYGSIWYLKDEGILFLTKKHWFQKNEN